MVRIECEMVKGRDLEPGDLFSTVGAEYWNNFADKKSLGERVYIRTFVDGTEVDPEGMEQDIVKITVVKEEDHD